MSASCAPNGAAHQKPSGPPWWFVENITKLFLSRTNHVGSPWLSRSVVSGSARQITRNFPTRLATPVSVSSFMISPEFRAFARA